MPRNARPWFSAEKGWWMVHLGGKKVRLAKGKANKKVAERRFGTRAIVNGVDLKTVSELMGHTTTRMTEHYLHLAGQREHLAAAMLRANGQSPGS